MYWSLIPLCTPKDFASVWTNHQTSLVRVSSLFEFPLIQDPIRICLGEMFQLNTEIYKKRSDTPDSTLRISRYNTGTTYLRELNEGCELLSHIPSSWRRHLVTSVIKSLHDSEFYIFLDPDLSVGTPSRCWPITGHYLKSITRRENLYNHFLLGLVRHRRPPVFPSYDWEPNVCKLTVEIFCH